MMSDDEQSLASRWLMFEASALVGASILERAPFKRAFYLIFITRRFAAFYAASRRFAANGEREGMIYALGIGAVCREGSA